MEPPLSGTLQTARDDALGASDTCGLIERLRRREVAAGELREAALARIEQADPSVNAVVYRIEGIADAVPSPDGPFAGIPLPIKDTDNIAGYPTFWGSHAFDDTPARESSVFVRHLMALGFAPLVKTTMPEFGLTGTTQSSRFGDTRNPWDLSRSVGGSSGGSAALVAAGAVPMAHANDGGGSVRIPASACGLVGMKPSRGRLLDRPELERVPINLFTQGVVTRTVRDTARFYAEAERLYRNPALPPIGLVDRPLEDRLRIAVLTDGLSGIEVGGEVHAAVRATARLCESLGHRVDVESTPYPDRVARDFLRYWTMLAWFFKHTGRLLFSPTFDGSRTEAFTDGLAALFVQQAERVPPALRRLQRLGAQGLPLFERYDVVLDPTLGHAPPPLPWLAPDVPFRTHLVRLLRFVTSTPLDNITGNPAITLPLARSGEGLPLGMQFSAPRGREALLLGLALQLEQAAPWPAGPATG